MAAELAGVPSRGLLSAPLLDRPVRALLVCGSHTLGASAQLALIAEVWGTPAVVDTAAALLDPALAGSDAASSARRAFDGKRVIVLTTERRRSTEHNTLAHGERVMSALTTAVATLLPEVDVVVAKGGITSAEVARIGIGATSAVVLGQVLPGVSVWRLVARDGREVLYVVVPGNVGGPDTLARVLEALDVAAPPLRSAPRGRVLKLLTRSRLSPVDQSAPANQDAGEADKAVVEVEAAFPAHGEPAELMQQGEGLLDDVAQFAQAFDAVGLGLGDDRFGAACAAGLAERLAAVGLMSGVCCVIDWGSRQA